MHVGAGIGFPSLVEGARTRRHPGQHHQPGLSGTELWLGDHGVAQTVAQAAGTDPAEGAAQAAAGAVTGRFTARPRSPTSSSCWPATAPAVSPARTSRLTAASSRPCNRPNDYRDVGGGFGLLFRSRPRSCWLAPSRRCRELAFPGSGVHRGARGGPATGGAPSFGAPGGRGAQFVFAHHCHRRVWGSQSCVPTSAWSAGSANAMTSLRTFANEDGTRSSRCCLRRQAAQRAWPRVA